MLQIFLVVLLAIGGIPSAHLHPLFFNNRIIGGIETSIEKHPYIVSLQIRGIHVCGGAIINEDTVLTAAHCVDGTPALFYNIRAGSTSCFLGGVRVSIKSIIVHEDYNTANSDNDIAILKLRQPLTFSDSIQPIKLPESDQEPATGTEVVVSGWGVIKEGSELTRINLREVSLNIIDQNECRLSYPQHTITESMICAGVPGGGQDACQGDSGGPLVENDILIGLVSWGIGCARPEYPGVNVRIANLRSWISKNTGV